MTLRQLLLCTLLCALSFVCTMAQTSDRAHARVVKKTLTDAKTNIKAGSNLAATEQTLRTLLDDSANINNEKIWLTLFDAIRAQYDNANENLYLKQANDTATLFTHTLHLFEVYTKIDSLNAQHITGKAEVPRYQQRMNAYLLPRKVNLYSGGGYYLRQNNYAAAEQYFAAYLAYEQQQRARQNITDSQKEARAAYWALYCAYKQTHPEDVSKYAARALQDSINEVYTLQYMAEAYAQQQDTAALHRTLCRGVEHNPTNPYFFKQLATYYSRRQEQDSMMLLAEKALSIDSLYVPAMIVKSVVLFRQKKYDDCIKLCEKIVTCDDSLLAPYINAGLAYYNQTIPISQKKKPTAEEQRRRQELYIRALPYLETCRQRAPETINIWGQPLYDIYLNLNMGEEFEEIEQLLTTTK